MAEKSNISWTDSTLNFWEGCTKVSAGCANCYAEARDKRFTGGLHWGKGAPRRKSKSAVRDALAFNRKPWICDGCAEASTRQPGRTSYTVGTVGWCDKCQTDTSWHRRRIFSLSLGDWLDAEVSIEWLAEMLDTIRQCDQVTWILCTKRPENWYSQMVRVLEHDAGAAIDQIEDSFPVSELGEWVNNWTGGEFPKNIILLTSVENQEQADKRIPELLKIPAACRGLSLEPLLGPVNIRDTGLSSFDWRSLIPWWIIGGESGPNARPCNVDWIRSLVKQGQAAGCATFVKQLGANPHADIEVSCDTIPLAGLRGVQLRPLKLSDKKGGNPAEWPAVLRVQEWPKGF